MLFLLKRLEIKDILNFLGDVVKILSEPGELFKKNVHDIMDLAADLENLKVVENDENAIANQKYENLLQFGKNASDIQQQQQQDKDTEETIAEKYARNAIKDYFFQFFTYLLHSHHIY
jgi:hypothetical protein